MWHRDCGRSSVTEAQHDSSGLRVGIPALPVFALDVSEYQLIDLSGIDKLTCKRGLALQDRGLYTQYVDVSTHCERIFS